MKNERTTKWIWIIYKMKVAQFLFWLWQIHCLMESHLFQFCFLIICEMKISEKPKWYTVGTQMRANLSKFVIIFDKNVINHKESGVNKIWSMSYIGRRREVGSSTMGIYWKIIIFVCFAKCQSIMFMMERWLDMRCCRFLLFFATSVNR